MLNTKFVTFEGYDGAGKSTLIDAVRGLLQPSTVRIVGRKNEPELHGISGVIESEDLRPHPEVEVLLRMGLEMERWSVIAEALQNYDLACCDRGVISLASWFDYLDVAREPYEPLVQQIADNYRNSAIFVCTADFDTCWARIADRPDPSAKERLGVDANRRFFSMYEANVAFYEDLGFDIVRIDTVRPPVAESASAVVEALISRGLWSSSETL